MKKVLFIASSGGHLKQLLMLEQLFVDYNSVIIIENSPANYWLKKNMRKFIYFAVMQKVKT